MYPIKYKPTYSTDAADNPKSVSKREENLSL